MRRNELLRLTSDDTAAPPVIEERPGRYLGYFVNKFGEQLVFVHDDGDAHATLFTGTSTGSRIASLTQAVGRMRET
jgi:hypothetical protein